MYFKRVISWLYLLGMPRNNNQHSSSEYSYQTVASKYYFPLEELGLFRGTTGSRCRAENIREKPKTHCSSRRQESKDYWISDKKTRGATYGGFHWLSNTITSSTKKNIVHNGNIPKY